MEVCIKATELHSTLLLHLCDHPLVGVMVHVVQALHAAGKVPQKCLSFKGTPGEAGYQRELQILTSCFVYKGGLLAKGAHAQTYKVVTEDVYQTYPLAELFGGQLKERSVEDIW
jgi:hypothetical protein